MRSQARKRGSTVIKSREKVAVWEAIRSPNMIACRLTTPARQRRRRRRRRRRRTRFEAEADCPGWANALLRSFRNSIAMPQVTDP
jgi:hypothetical protein